MAQNIAFAPDANGDIACTYVNRYGTTLLAHIYIGTDDVTVSTIHASKALPFGRRAIADVAINNPAYRAKVVQTAKDILVGMINAEDEPAACALREKDALAAWRRVAA